MDDLKLLDKIIRQFKYPNGRPAYWRTLYPFPGMIIVQHAIAKFQSGNAKPKDIEIIKSYCRLHGCRDLEEINDIEQLARYLSQHEELDINQPT